MITVEPSERGAGHRRRLRERFLQSSLDGFLDYEIVELLLTLGTPRKDCKSVAKEAISRFGGLKGVLDSEIIELQNIKGIGPSNAFGIKLFQAISERVGKENLIGENKLDSPEKVYKYLREKIGREKKEHFVVLCLDSRKNLITDDVSVGILNASLVHPREVFNEAIKVHAAQIIVAHNHPSGDASPSEDDILTAKRLLEAGKILGVTVLDSLIITRDSYISLKKEGLL